MGMKNGRNVDPGRHGGEDERAARRELRRIEREWGACELRLMRARLQRMVRSVSPVLIDVAAAERLDLGRMMRALRPGHSSPGGSLVRREVSNQVRLIDHALIRGYARWAFRRNAKVVRDEVHPLGVFAYGVGSDCVDVAVSLGDGVLETFGDRGVLTLPHSFPDTVLASVAGRRLEDVIAHSLTVGRGYVATGASPGRWGTMLVGVRVGTVPFTMPWGD